VRFGRLDGGRLLELMRKELRQTLRDPKAFRLVLAAPIIQLIVFGYAVNTDVRNASVILFDRDHTAVSRKLAQAPIDDEPETEEERRAVERSKEWLRHRGGKGIPHTEILQDFGLTTEDFHHMAHGKKD
jgi:hypothetical protein